MGRTGSPNITIMSEIAVRLVRPGDGRSVVEVAEAVRAHGGWADVRPLRRVLDRAGGRIALPDLPGGIGVCVAALADGEVVGMLYACTPVNAVMASEPGLRDTLLRTLMEIEIVAVVPHAQGTGVGTALLRYATQYLHSAGTQVLTAKIGAADMPVLRWWRHRGWTLAGNGEACYLDRRGGVGLDAGQDGQWRLAVHSPDRALTPRASGLWVTPALV